MTEPNQDQNMTDEAIYARAHELTKGYVRTYHQSLFWYLLKNCHVTSEMAEDALQDLWLHVFQQLKVRGRDKMYKTFLYNKAYWICMALKIKGDRDNPFDLGGIDLRDYHELKDEEDRTSSKMLAKDFEEGQSPSHYYKGIRRAEPTNAEEEKALFDSFWANYPNVDLTETQKLIAFDLFRYGLTLKEVSLKYNIPISTVSDWKRKIVEEIEKAHNNEEES